MDSLTIELLLTRSETLADEPQRVENGAKHDRIRERNERVSAVLRERFPGLEEGPPSDEDDALEPEPGESRKAFRQRLDRTRRLCEESENRVLHICLWDDDAEAVLYLEPASPADLALNLGTFAALVASLAGEAGMELYAPGTATTGRSGIRAEIDRQVAEQQARIARRKAQERRLERLFWPLLAALAVGASGFLSWYGAQGVHEARLVSQVDVASPRRLLVMSTAPTDQALMIHGKIVETGEAARTEIDPGRATSAPPGSELLVFPRWDVADGYVERLEYEAMHPVWVLDSTPFSIKTLFSLGALVAGLAAFVLLYLRHPEDRRRARRLAFVRGLPQTILVSAIVFAIFPMLRAWLA